MDRRRFLRWCGGVVAAVTLLPAGVAGFDDHEAGSDGLADEQREEGLDGSERTLEGIEQRARESPSDLSEEVRRLLADHADHDACPVCQGIGSAGGLSGRGDL